MSSTDQMNFALHNDAQKILLWLLLVH